MTDLIPITELNAVDIAETLTISMKMIKENVLQKKVVYVKSLSNNVSFI